MAGPTEEEDVDEFTLYLEKLKKQELAAKQGLVGSPVQDTDEFGAYLEKQKPQQMRASLPGATGPDRMTNRTDSAVLAKARQVEADIASATRKARVGPVDKRANAAADAAMAEFGKKLDNPFLMAMGGNAMQITGRDAAENVYEQEGVVSSATAHEANLLNSVALGLPAILNKDARQFLAQATADRPLASLSAQVIGSLAPLSGMFTAGRAGANAAARGLSVPVPFTGKTITTPNLIPTGGDAASRLTRYSGQLANDVGNTALGTGAYQAMINEPIQSAAEGRELTLGSMGEAGARGFTDPFNLIPLAASGTMRTWNALTSGVAAPSPKAAQMVNQYGVGPRQTPGSAGIAQTAQQFGGRVRPQDIRGLTNIENALRFALRDVPGVNVNARIADGFQRIRQSLPLVDDPTMNLARLIEREFAEDAPQIRAIIRNFLGKVGTGSSAGETIVGGAANQMRGAQADVLEQEAMSVFGNQPKQNAKEVLEQNLELLGEETYAPIMRAATSAPPQAQQRAAAMIDRRPEAEDLLFNRADRQGLTVPEYIARNPLDALHWVQSGLAKQARALRAANNPDTALEGVIQNMKTVLRDNVPNYREADELYASNARALGRLGTTRGPDAGVEGELKYDPGFGEGLLGPGGAAGRAEGRATASNVYEGMDERSRRAAAISVREVILDDLNKARAAGDEQRYEIAARFSKLNSEGALQALVDVFGDEGRRIVNRIRQFVDANEFARDIDPITGSNTKNKFTAAQTGAQPFAGPMGQATQSAAGSLGQNAVGDAFLMASGITSAPLMSAIRVVPWLADRLQPGARTQRNIAETLLRRGQIGSQVQPPPRGPGPIEPLDPTTLPGYRPPGGSAPPQGNPIASNGVHASIMSGLMPSRPPSFVSTPDQAMRSALAGRTAPIPGPDTGPGVGPGNLPKTPQQAARVQRETEAASIRMSVGAKASAAIDQGRNIPLRAPPSAMLQAIDNEVKMTSDEKQTFMRVFGDQVRVSRGEVAAFFKTVADPRNHFSHKVEGFGLIAQRMTNEEIASLSKITAPQVVSILEDLRRISPVGESAAVAIAGGAKKGWYLRSQRALQRVFGDDAPRFAAVLAAMSPQTSVESNLANAVAFWTNWTKAGRPNDEKSVLAILGRSVQGNKGDDSVLDAWRNNTVRSILTENAEDALLSGPKVDSFRRNLRARNNPAAASASSQPARRGSNSSMDDSEYAVTNDAWMANYFNIDQEMFARGGGKALPGYSPGYLATNVYVREVAEYLSKVTGERWTPREVQETIWSWAKTLYEARAAAGETRTAAQLIGQKALTDLQIGGTPDFAILLKDNPALRAVLKEAGYGQQLDDLAGASGAVYGDAPGFLGVRTGPQDATGSGISQRDYERRLGRAASRLDDLAQRRARDARAERVRTTRSNLAGDGAAPRAYTRGSGRDGQTVRFLGQPVAATYTPDKAYQSAYAKNQIEMPDVHELPANIKAGEAYAKRMKEAAARSKFGAAVNVYSPEEYAEMRLFVTADNKSGFALKGDDIVSVWSDPKGPSGRTDSLLPMAVQMGGRRLDAFDTVLPEIYAKHGFRIESRLSWNDEFAPTGWDKGTYARFNNGEPDVVFMVWDPAYKGAPRAKDGVRATSYDEAVEVQAAAQKAIADRIAAEYKPPEPGQVNETQQSGRRTVGKPKKPSKIGTRTADAAAITTLAVGGPAAQADTEDANKTKLAELAQQQANEQSKVDQYEQALKAFEAMPPKEKQAFLKNNGYTGRNGETINPDGDVRGITGFAIETYKNKIGADIATAKAERDKAEKEATRLEVAMAMRPQKEVNPLIDKAQEMATYGAMIYGAHRLRKMGLDHRQGEANKVAAKANALLTRLPVPPETPRRTLYSRVPIAGSKEKARIKRETTAANKAQFATEERLSGRYIPPVSSNPTSPDGLPVRLANVDEFDRQAAAGDFGPVSRIGRFMEPVNSRFTGGDLSLIGGGMADAYIMQGMLDKTREEIRTEEAKLEAAKLEDGGVGNPAQIDLSSRRLEQLRTTEQVQVVLQRVGIGLAIGSTVALGHGRYARPQPRYEAAARERDLVNRAMAPAPPPPAPPPSTGRAPTTPRTVGKPKPKPPVRMSFSSGRPPKAQNDNN
jgi:hypothetical protein